MNKEVAKVGAFFAGSVALLTIYGAEVCPFLERLTHVQLAGILAGAFALSYGFRCLIHSQLRRRGDRTDQVSLASPWLHLIVDLGVWCLAGLLVTGWNAVI